jgi:hypothetical protein
MFGRQNLRPLWLVGLVMLAVAQGMHAYEHWEIAANRDCVAHVHDHDSHGDHGDTGSQHQHGCTSHDHAPALAGGSFVLTVSMSVESFVSERFEAPTPPTSSIDHPPQLS